jgi:hypothetical protein
MTNNDWHVKQAWKNVIIIKFFPEYHEVVWIIKDYEWHVELDRLNDRFVAD